ncbi:MAG: hypothetical protein WC451_02690 [Patescibacteria group bacterium]
MRRIIFAGLAASSVLKSGLDGAMAVKMAWERERLKIEGFPGRAEKIEKILDADFEIKEGEKEVEYKLRV